jgi:hypothetical protein
MITTGIVLVAVGNECYKEAQICVKSIREIYKNLPITLFTDNSNEINGVDRTILVKPSNDMFLNKVEKLIESPYDKTLFLDSDTFLCSDIDDGFDLLDKFDMLFCHAPFRQTGYDIDIPEAFSEINTGVIFYKKNDKVQNFLKNWVSTYRLDLDNKSVLGYFNDQTSFLKCLYDDNHLKYYILPSEFNLRIVFPFLVGGSGKIRILHGKGSQLAKAIKIPKQTSNIRIFKL